MAKTEILRRIDESVKAVDTRLTELSFICQNVLKNPAAAKQSGYGSKSKAACTAVEVQIGLIKDALGKWDEYTAAWEKPCSNKLKEVQRLAKKVLMSDSRKRAKVIGEGLKQHNAGNHDLVTRVKTNLEAVFG